MLQEQEKRDVRSPFERLKDWFEKMPKPQVSDPNFARRVELGDRTSVLLYTTDIPYVQTHTIFVVPSETRYPNSQHFAFPIDEEGLREIHPTNVIGFNCSKIRVDGVLFSEEEGESRTIIVSAQIEASMAKTLVDWFDKVMQEGKYSKPPVSASSR